MSKTETTCRFEELDGGVLAVTLRPELNEVPWTDIERLGSGIVTRVAGRPSPRVVVDLSELHYMGSAMVALVVRIWKTVTDGDGRMVVVNRNEVVDEVLRISGLASRWTIVTDRPEALAALRAGEGGANGRPSRIGSIATIAAGVLLLVAILLLADSAAGGLLAAGSQARTVAIAGLLLALGAAVAAVFGIARATGTLRLVAVSLATLSVVAAAIGIYLVVRPPNRPAVEPAREATVPRVQAPGERPLPGETPAASDVP